MSSLLDDAAQSGLSSKNNSSCDGVPISTEMGVTFHPLLVDQLRDHFPNYMEGLVRGEPGGFVLSPEYARNADTIRHFEPRTDDVWIITFPKCGTTWMQELVWQVVNDCNEEAAKLPLMMRSPFLEMSHMISHIPIPGMPDRASELQKFIPTLEQIEARPSPRVIKSHLPLYLLHPKLLDTSKIVYVVRNPKDVIVSYFHHHKLIKLHSFHGDVDKFAHYFMDDQLMFSPFFPHVLEAWAKKDHPNMLFVFYEDLKKDLKGQVEKIANFIGKTLSKEQLAGLVNHLRFDAMAKNEAVNCESLKLVGVVNEEGRFIRKGKTGDWKNHFDTEMSAKIDEWIEKNIEGTGLSFVSELENQD